MLVVSLVFAALVCGYSLRTAARFVMEAQADLAALRRAIDSHLSRGDVVSIVPQVLASVPDDNVLVGSDIYKLPVGKTKGGFAREIEALVDEIFLRAGPELSSGALTELLSHASLMQIKVAALNRGLSRVPFLGGLAAAILMMASLGANTDILKWVLACVGLGLVSSLLCQLTLNRGRRFIKEFRYLSELLEGEMDKLPKQKTLSR